MPIYQPGSVLVPSPIQGTERIEVDNGGAVTAEVTTQQIAQLASAGVLNAYVAATNTAGFTASAAQVYAGSDETALNLTGTLASGQNIQLPTVAALAAALPNFIAGQAFKLRVINSSGGAFAWTVTTNTGWTLTGTMTIAQNTWRDFYVTMTSAAAAVLQAVGTGTQS